MSNYCPWCNWKYPGEITRAAEDEHLKGCQVFQGLPVAEVVDGKEYVRLPSDPEILCERPASLRRAN
jgi:hypothetical protein